MRKSAAAYADQSDPVRNRQFARRWSEAPRATRISAEPIRLIEVPSALDADGEPRAALLVPPGASSVSRRPNVRVFPSISAAVAEKRRLEAGR